MESTEKKVIGNPVLPKPPVPSQVRGSQLMPPPPPIEKKKSGEAEALKEIDKVDAKARVQEIKRELDVEPKGTILIKIYEDHPYEIDFSGKITGSEVDIAWRAMMKAYRVWKHKVFREKEFGGV